MAARSAADRTERRIGSREATRVRGATGGGPPGGGGSRALLGPAPCPPGGGLAGLCPPALRPPGARDPQAPGGSPARALRPGSAVARCLGPPEDLLEGDHEPPHLLGRADRYAGALGP